jgi:hypothetical protein
MINAQPPSPNFQSERACRGLSVWELAVGRWEFGGTRFSSSC